MSQQENLKIQIKNLIEQFSNLDLSLLYHNQSSLSPWQGLMGREEIERFVLQVRDVLIKLKNNTDVLDHSMGYIQAIYDSLNSIVSNYSQVSSIPRDQLTSQNHAVLDIFNNLNSYIKATGIYFDLNYISDETLEEKEQRLSKADLLAKDMLNHENDFRLATINLKEFIENKGDVVQILLLEKGQVFEERSEEYKTYKNIYCRFIPWGGNVKWLYLTVFFGCITLFFAYNIAEHIGNVSGISFGAALIRISTLIIPSFFTYIFAQLFLQGEKLHEFYKFKSIAISTLAMLYKEYSSEKEKILEKAVSVIFQEYSTSKKSGDVSQKDLLAFLGNVVK